MSLNNEFGSPNLKILTHYIKDLSFENFYAQNNNFQNVNPKVNIDLKINKKKLTEDKFEVSLIFFITATTQDEQIFLLEISYGGLFELKNLDKTKDKKIFYIECPKILYPFIRRIIYDLVRDGGFPAINLQHVDFDAIYQKGR